MQPWVDLATELSGAGEGWVWSAVLVFLRLGAVLALMPAFGEAMVPARIRLAAALAFSAVLVPMIGPVDPAGLSLLTGAVEVAKRLILGMGLRLFVLALQTAAAIAGNALSLAQLFGGTGPEPQPAIGNLLTMAALALALALGLHVKLVAMLAMSFELVPPGHIPDWQAVTGWGIQRVAASFALAFTLAAPFVVSALVYNLALGIVNRAMPMLMVTTVGAPALAAGALLLMAILFPLVLLVWHQAFDAFLAKPFRTSP